jgi:hypothetical protein
MNSEESNDETSKEGKCVGSAGGIKSLKENKRCDDCRCCETDKIHGVDAKLGDEASEHIKSERYVHVCGKSV